MNAVVKVKVGKARRAVRAAFSGATSVSQRWARIVFRPLVRGRGHRSAMSLPGCL
jgi:hypothetical protein